MTKTAIGLGLIVLAIVVFGLLPYAGNDKPNVDIPQDFEPETFDVSIEELETWVWGARTAEYNVDVKVKTHAWERHGADATNAIKCLTNNGTAMVLSEKSSRNLHLICVDQKTGETYVAVIERILRYKDTIRNATSTLITAFKLKDVTIDQYVGWETQIKCIVVRLQFLPGELFFKP